MKRDRNDRQDVIRITDALADSLVSAARFRYRDPDRAVLTGIYLDKRGRVVGTDGRRLLIRHSPEMECLSESVILAGCTEENLAGANGGELVIGLTEAVLHGTARSDAVFPLVSGKYPDYEAVIPTSHRYLIELKTQRLQELCDEIRPYLRARHSEIAGASYLPLVEIHFDETGHSIAMRTSSTLGYCTKSGMPSASIGQVPMWQHVAGLEGKWKGEGSDPAFVTMGMNFDYFQDALAGVSRYCDGKVEILVLDDTKALIIQANGGKDRALVMPVRLT